MIYGIGWTNYVHFWITWLIIVFRKTNIRQISIFIQPYRVHKMAINVFYAWNVKKRFYINGFRACKFMHSDAYGTHSIVMHYDTKVKLVGRKSIQRSYLLRLSFIFAFIVIEFDDWFGI